MAAPHELGSMNSKNWGHLQELADSLEESWKQGVPTDLARMLPPVGAPTRGPILHELIKTDLACRWRHGQATVLDYYLEKFPEDLGTAQTVSAALIYEEYRVRHLYGDRPTLQQLNARFPQQFAELERLVQENPMPTRRGASLTSKAASPSQAASSQVAPSLVKNLVLPEGYTPIKRIGTGGFAEVWMVQAPGGFQKAMKVIVRPVDQEESRREVESMELIKNLRHHFLMPTHAYWVLEDRLIILMDLADGSLRDTLNQCRKEGKTAIPLPDLLKYIRQSAEALDYLHEKNVRHRDIKPENILLTEGNVRVADFGLAKAQGTQRMVTGTFAGTPLYMPPETWEDKNHLHGDQYSLAATYYELRTGRRLFKESGLPALMHSHLHERPLLDSLGAAEQEVLQQALSKNPENRFPNCMSFVRALENAVGPELATDGAAMPISVAGKATVSQAAVNKAAASQAPVSQAVVSPPGPGGEQLHTIMPGETVKPTWNKPAQVSTVKPAVATESLSPAVVRESGTQAQPSSLPGLVMGIIVVLALVGFFAWIFLVPATETGDLALDPLPLQLVTAGKTTTLSVSIKRDNFNEPVRLKFKHGPEITMDDATIPGGAASAAVTLKVSDQATPGPRKLGLEAAGGTHCAYADIDLVIEAGAK